MSDPPEFDLFGSISARDDALGRVSGRAGAFMGDALSAIGRLPHGMLLTGEDVRLRLREIGIRPHHHNAWGSLIKTAVDRKLLEPTGRWFRMKDVSSHARRTPEYRVK
jgi:hypothetical protein